MGCKVDQKTPIDCGHGKEPERRPWTAPRLEHFGRMNDLVQGSGKSGSNLDGDPNIEFKVGIG